MARPTFSRAIGRVEPDQPVRDGAEAWSTLYENSKAIRELMLPMNFDEVSEAAGPTVVQTYFVEIPEGADPGHDVELKLRHETKIDGIGIGSVRFRDVGSGTVATSSAATSDWTAATITMIGADAWRGTTREIEIELEAGSADAVWFRMRDTFWRITY